MEAQAGFKRSEGETPGEVDVVEVQLDDTEEEGCRLPGNGLHMTVDILAGFGRGITWQPATNNFLKGKDTVDICVTRSANSPAVPLQLLFHFPPFFNNLPPKEGF